MKNIYEISSYFLSKQKMSSLKLSGLLYFSYAWGFSIFNTEIAPLNFIATGQGPEEINLINKKNQKFEQVFIKPEWNDETKFLEAIWQTYGRYSAKKLMKIARNHIPWRTTRENQPIESEKIKEFYKEISNRYETPM